MTCAQTKRLIVVAAAAAAWCMACAATTVSAATYYWDNTTPMSASGFGTAGGVWGTDALWSTSNVGTATSGTLTTGTADNVFFGTSTVGNGLATGTIGVNGTVSILNITVGSQSGALTLGTSVSSGTITMGNNATGIANNSSSVLTINSDISLVTGSPNTRGVTGKVTLNGNTLGSAGIWSIGAGGILTLAGSGTGTQLAGAGAVIIGANNLTWGTLTQTGGLDLNGNNLTLGNLQSTSGTITDNATGSGTSTLTSNGGNTSTFSGTIADGATRKVAFVHNGTGALTLNAANTFSGNTRVAQATRTITLGTNLAIQNSAIDTSGAGSFVLGTGVTTPTIGGLLGSKNLSSVITGSYALMTALTLNTVAGQNLTYSGTIADGATGMTLTKTGSGIQTLSAANTFTGATTISAGQLHISAGNINSSSYWW